MLINFFGGIPILAPKSVVSPKMSILVLIMTPLFYSAILSYPKNGDVNMLSSKKLHIIFLLI